MIKNILADVMVGFGIIILVIGMLFVFDIWPVSGESKQQIKQAENNTEQEYFTQKQMPKFNTNFAWERNLPFNINNINFKKEFTEEKKEIEKVEIVIPAGTSASVIANKLSEKGIMDKERFIDILIIFDAEKKLNPGTYVFEKDADVLEVFSKILVGGGVYRD